MLAMMQRRDDTRTTEGAEPCLIVAPAGRQRRLRRLCGLLRGAGWRVQVVADAQAALAACRRRMPRLMLVAADGDPGLDLLRRLARLPGRERCTVFALADAPDAMQLGRMVVAGAADCISPAIDAEVLRVKLRQARLRHVL
ncbi:MAG TPA: hypothetical protein ENK15_00610 [Thermopetrobacter sp.]|nr:hypothetical protein [Thermopetrobacter sp.]